MRLEVCELGKFHGLSLAMKDQKPNEFAQFNKVDDYLWTVFQSENVQCNRSAVFDCIIDVLKNDEHILFS